MPIAPKIEQFLSTKHIQFNILHHPHTNSAYDTACTSHVPSIQVAKAVLLKDDEGYYTVAIIPAENKLMMRWVDKETGKKFRFASEEEVFQVFPDCDPGAIPPLAEPYHVSTVWDDQLASQDQVYLEGGSHEDLIHITQDTFQQLMEKLPHSVISADSYQFSPYHGDDLRSF